MVIDSVVVDTEKYWPEEDRQELDRWAEDVMSIKDITKVVPPQWSSRRSHALRQSGPHLMGDVAQSVGDVTDNQP